LSDDGGQDPEPLFRIILASVFLFLIYRLYEFLKLWIQDSVNYWKAVFIIVLFGGLLLGFLIGKILLIRKKNLFDQAILAKEGDSVFCGITDEGKEVWIKPQQRTMHTQIIGTTNAGKTESVIIPWAVNDIFSGRGLILIDGKADNTLLDKLWSYSVKAGREKDFRLFSLGRRDISQQFNPLLGGTAEEVTERVFNSFDFENPYYRSLQYEVMSQVMRIFENSGTTPSFQRLYQAISEPAFLRKLKLLRPDRGLEDWIQWYESLALKERETRTSGLLSSIGHFAFGANAELFNPNEGAITLNEALKKNQILYFQLPVLLSPFLGKATGKLVLQSLQAAIANRHRGGERKFFGVYLDDFSEYLYPGFVSILNKSRSANIGVVFAHQALGDIQTLGEPVANSILTNSNLKVFMRGNTPDSAEYFSKVIGTKSSTKFTERQKKGRFGIEKSGDVSARDVEEFLIHPNSFKRDLGVGEAIMIIPHSGGAKTVKLKFNKIDDLQPEVMLPAEKSILPLLERTLSQPQMATENPFNFKS
jgi:type IV secretory pathway TraG/TraD family ATPase VirD4